MLTDDQLVHSCQNTDLETIDILPKMMTAQYMQRVVRVLRASSDASSCVSAVVRAMPEIVAPPLFKINDEF